MLVPKKTAVKPTRGAYSQQSQAAHTMSMFYYCTTARYYYILSTYPTYLPILVYLCTFPGTTFYFALYLHTTYYYCNYVVLTMYAYCQRTPHVSCACLQRLKKYKEKGLMPNRETSCRLLMKRAQHHRYERRLLALKESFHRKRDSLRSKSLILKINSGQ